MADDDGPHTPMGVVDDRNDVAGPGLDRVGLTSPAVTVTREVDGDDVMRVGEQRGDVPPPLGMRGAAVHEDQPRRFPVSPLEEVDLGSVDGHPSIGAGHRQGPFEPAGRRVGHGARP